jgi:hypothetical protein
VPASLSTTMYCSHMPACMLPTCLPACLPAFLLATQRRSCRGPAPPELHADSMWHLRRQHRAAASRGCCWCCHVQCGLHHSGAGLAQPGVGSAQQLLVMCRLCRTWTVGCRQGRLHRPRVHPYALCNASSCDLAGHVAARRHARPAADVVAPANHAAGHQQCARATHTRWQHAGTRSPARHWGRRCWLCSHAAWVVLCRLSEAREVNMVHRAWRCWQHPAGCVPSVFPLHSSFSIFRHGTHDSWSKQP